MIKHPDCEREYDFALILTGINELTSAAEDALFEAGCDDATLSVQYGLVYVEFSRKAASLKDAILSAIRDIRKAKIGADVLRVDECDLVTPAEIARRINRSRQLVHQYMTGQRGPGSFPPPVCHLTEKTPLWLWCEVSFWLCQNDMIRPEQLQEAEAIAVINNALDLVRQRGRNSELVEEVTQAVNELQKCG
ncbi:MAG: hypothetical protein ACYC3I_20240 [Gemmataceae bacterium]